MSHRPSSAAGILLLLIATLLTTAADAATVDREFRYERSRISLHEQEGRTVVTFDGGTRETAPGRPDLPRVAERLELPEGMRVVRVEVVSMTTEPLAEAVRLRTAVRSRAGLEPEEATPEDPVAYAMPGFQPAEVVRLGAQGLERGRGVALLEVSPVRWDAVSGRLERVASVRVRVVLEVAAWPEGVRRERVVRDWEPAGGAGAPRLATPSALSGERVAQPFAATQVPSVLGSPVAYVIITDDAMAPEYQRLADWKTRSGVPAVVRTLSFIRQEYPQGADDAERMRLFIRDAYSRWGTLWVLLGGDTDVLQTRYARTTFYGGEYIPCDMYFSCLDGNWNADGDSLYGEGYVSLSDPGDSADLFPDVYVGRAPTTSVEQAALFVDKTLKYAQDPAPGAYQRKLLFFAEVLFPQNWSPGMSTTFDGAELVEEVLPYVDLNPSITAVRLYENYLDARWRPGALEERRVTVIDSLNAGYNLAVHVGHGFTNVMSVGDDNLTNADALGLTNGDRLMNLYAINCSSNAIDFPCIGEAFLHAPNGGAVTNVGSTRFDFPTAGRAFKKEYFRLMYQDSLDAVGELNARQKIPFIGFSAFDGVNRWTQMTLLLLGDPELRIYNGLPRQLAVTHDPTMVLSDTAFAVHVETGGLPLEGARVTLFRAGDVYTTGLTNAVGDITLRFHPDSLGTFDVTVTAYTAKPYRGTVTLAPAGLPALSDVSVTVDDDPVNGTSGNGDGVLDAGETIDLVVPVRNAGALGAPAVTGTLSTTDPLPVLSSPVASYGTIAGGATATPAAGFRVQVPASMGDQREIPFTLVLTDGLGSRFVETFQLTVRAPELFHDGQGVVDAGGDGDGQVDPGETVTYTVRLRNRGTGLASAVTAVLRSLDAGVTVTDSTTAFGDIPASEERTGDALVFVATTDTTRLELRATDALGRSLVRVLDLRTPQIPADLRAKGGTVDIALSWGEAPDPDLYGYNVYRGSSPAGPFARVTTVPIGRTASYLDVGLPPFTTYHYRVAAVDSSGNESAPSAIAGASTSLPNHTVFPVLTGRSTPSSVAIDHVYPGRPVAIAAGADVLYVWHPDGTAPVEADGQGTSLGDFTTRGKYYAGGVSIGDIDSDGVPEFVATTWDSMRVYAFDREGAVKPGFPVVTGESFGGVALGDIDGDGDDELAFATNTNRFYVLHGNGTELLDGDANAGTLGVFKVLAGSYNFGTPALADLDGDGRQDIVFGGSDGQLNAWRWNGTSLPGFPVALGGGISASPAIGMLDGPGDTQLEIVVPATDESLYVLKSDGGRRAGFPVRIKASGVSKTPSPALADMDGDGYLDIVQATTDGVIRVYDRFGAQLAPWTGGARFTYLTEYASESSPVVADIDGDGLNDVVMGGEDLTVTALSGADAQTMPGFPIPLGGQVRGTPAVCDCDGDGMTELVLANWDQMIYMWDYDFPFSPGQAPPWPQFHHDARRTGLASSLAFVGVDADPVGGADVPTLAFSVPRPNPARAETRLWYAVPAEAAGRPLDVSIFDLGGRRLRTLESGVARGGRFSTAWDLNGADGARVRDGVYFARIVLGDRALTHKIIVMR